MTINERLYELCREKAAAVTVETVSIGLGYTAVRTSDGGLGLAYTYLENKKGCAVRTNDFDYEGRPADLLLEEIRQPDPLGKSMALALVNALNHTAALKLPEDPQNEVLYNYFQIARGTRVSMVGYFGPLVKALEKKGAVLEIIDDHRSLGPPETFSTRLAEQTDVLVLTATSLLNDTADGILQQLGPGTRTVLLGPTTPMIAAAFEGLPVHMLAGAVPVKSGEIFKGVRSGMGAPVLLRACRKKYLPLPHAHRR